MQVEGKAGEAFYILTKPELLKELSNDSARFLKKYERLHTDYRRSGNCSKICLILDLDLLPSSCGTASNSAQTCPPSPLTRSSTSTRASLTS